MTDVLLINPPLARYDYAELAPPLSLLTIAGEVRRRGKECKIVDLNLPEHRVFGDDSPTFYAHVRKIVADVAPTEVGITSMGVNTHVALEVAQNIADIVEHIAIGGIHISGIAGEIRDLLPENVSVAPARRSAIGTEWWTAAPPTQPSEQLLAGFDLTPYFEANTRRVGNLEITVGCKYRCAFCYSPTAHPKWTNAAIDHVVNEFATMANHGFEHLFLIGDNLTNDPRWFAEAADALGASRSLVTWNGYATLPDLTPALIERAGASGCTNLYLGIDAVSPEQQIKWRKGFSKHARRMESILAAASDASVQITCAFVLDVRPEADPDTIASLGYAGELRALGADIRLAVLTEYPDTALFDGRRALEYSELRPSILMDLPAVVIENRFAPGQPNIFPWHARPMGESIWAKRLLAAHAAQTLFHSRFVLPDGGVDLWQTCLAIADEISCVPTVHKVELKDFVRNIYQTVAA